MHPRGRTSLIALRLRVVTLDATRRERVVSAPRSDDSDECTARARIDKDHFAKQKTDGHSTATASISTRADRGSSFTAKHARAGGSSLKYFPYILFTLLKSDMSARSTCAAHKERKRQPKFSMWMARDARAGDYCVRTQGQRTRTIAQTQNAHVRIIGDGMCEADVCEDGVAGALRAPLR